MEKRILGRTGVDVGVVGMGGLFVSRLGGTGREEARRAVQRALELGVNYVDTAPTYADSEEMLGYALAGAPTPTTYRPSWAAARSPSIPKTRPGCAAPSRRACVCSVGTISISCACAYPYARRDTPPARA